MLEQLQLILKALPWTGPAVLGGFVLALLTTLLFPTRRSRADRLGFALLTWCLVVAAVVTLSPVKNDYFGVPTAGCDWSVWRPLAREYWFSAGSRPPNVWLFLPAGVGVMLLDGVWRKILGVMVLFALPPGIETLQDLYPELKRSCSSQDVVDNWTGLVLGLTLGLVLAILLAIVRAISRASRRRRERRAGVLEGGSAQGAHPADARTDERLDDASRAAERPLPLGGRADSRPYDDFGDFDDTPSSTRWYERSGEAAVDHTPPYGTSRDEARTQALRPARANDGDDDARTQAFRPVRADNGDDDARTQAMRPGRAGRDVGTDGGASAPRHGRGGDDDTEIIRRT